MHTLFKPCARRAAARAVRAAVAQHALGLSLALCLAAAPFTLAQAQTAAAKPAPEHALAADSIYQLNAELTDQNGRTFKLRDHRGKPVLLSMFYTSCKFVCPLLINTMEFTQQGLNAQERAQLDLLLISFDPEHDDVKKLKSVAVSRELDSRQWTLARADSSSVRKIAATLGIQYRLLSDGDYNHSTVLLLLDGEGRIVGRSKKMGGPDAEFVKLVKKTLAANTALPS